MFELSATTIRSLKKWVTTHPWMSWAPVIGALSLLVLSVFAAVTLTMQSQDVRRSADELKRDVELVMVPSSTPLRTNSLNTIFIRLNTHGQQLDGVQVVFDLKGAGLDGVTLKVKEPSGLTRAWEKVEGIDSGKRISLAVITSTPDKPFSSDNPVDIAEIIFTTKDTGKLVMIFDDGQTKANRYGQVGNVLRPYVVQEYTIEVAPTPKPTPKPVTSSGTSTGGTSGSTSGTTTAGKGGATTGKSPLANVTVTTSSTSNLDQSSINSAIAKVCNKSCSYSSDCGDGFLCYRQQCRRIGNVSNATCATTDETVKLCNESCTSSSQCQSSLMCYQGRCRSSSNPEEISCGAQGTTIGQVNSIAELCNDECVTNSECGDSLQCYLGRCRLPSNPTADSCISGSASPSTTGSTIASSPSPSPTPEPTTGQPQSFLRTVITWLLILGVVAGLGVAGLMAYLWYKDQQSPEV